MTFKIGNSFWLIKFVNPSSEYLLNSRSEFTVGVADNNIKTIFLSNELQGEFLWKVLCHEITHAFCFEYNIILSIELEEKIADFISNFGSDIILLTNSIFKVIIKGVV